MSGQDGPVPNITLRNWRARHHLSRAELADKINRSQAGIADRLACDDERVRRWESGEVRWPSPAYRRALRQLTGLDPGQLGFLPHDQALTGQVVGRRIEAGEAIRSEAELFDTMDLAGMVTASDLGQSTLDTLQE